MNRRTEHDKIERLQRELDELRDAHYERTAKDCCGCHVHQPVITYPYPWYTGPYRFTPYFTPTVWNGTTTAAALSVGTSDNTTAHSLTVTS